MAKRDWYKIIDEALDKQNSIAFGDALFSAEDKKAAESWPDCACGVQDARIPRYIKNTSSYASGQPKDRSLYSLGCEFSAAVGNDEPYRAFYLLAKIDRRSGEILAKLARRAARKGK